MGSWVRPALLVVALVLLALAPWLGGAYATLSLTSALALGLFALSYDLVLGVTGLVSVSHATLARRLTSLNVPSSRSGTFDSASMSPEMRSMPTRASPQVPSVLPKSRPNPHSSIV